MSRQAIQELWERWDAHRGGCEHCHNAGLAAVEPAPGQFCSMGAAIRKAWLDAERVELLLRAATEDDFVEVAREIEYEHGGES